MHHGRVDHEPWMLTSLLLWLCTLPLVGLLVLPWFGTRAAVLTAAALLVASVAACYGVCTWQTAGLGRGGEDE